MMHEIDYSHPIMLSDNFFLHYFIFHQKKEQQRSEELMATFITAVLNGLNPCTLQVSVLNTI